MVKYEDIQVDRKYLIKNHDGHFSTYSKYITITSKTDLEMTYVYHGELTFRGVITKKRYNPNMLLDADNPLYKAINP